MGLLTKEKFIESLFWILKNRQPTQNEINILTAKYESSVLQDFDPQQVTNNTILNGVIDPIITDGKDGDFYINTTTNTIFGPKLANNWGSGTILGVNLDDLDGLISGSDFLAYYIISKS